MLLESIIIEEIAEYKVPSAVPQSKSIMEEFLPERVKARAVTKAPAKRAPAKAQKLTGEINAKIPFERIDDVAV